MLKNDANFRRVDGDGRLSSVGIYAPAAAAAGAASLVSGGNSERRCGVWWRRLDGGGWMVTDGDDKG